VADVELDAATDGFDLVDGLTEERGLGAGLDQEFDVADVGAFAA